MASTIHHVKLILILTILAMVSIVGVQAADPDPLQDFCVADVNAPGPLFNGFPCKDAQILTEEDFAFSGLANPGNLTGNPIGAVVTFGFVEQFPALNTLGLAMARLDIAPGGATVPHTHNLATEILICLEGEVYTGFVTNSDNAKVPNKVFAKVVKKGEAFIFPRGLLHFQLNKSTKPVVTLNVLNGQNPGFQGMPMGIFTSGIDPEVLARTFLITPKEVTKISKGLVAAFGGIVA